MRSGSSTSSAAHGRLKLEHPSLQLDGVSNRRRIPADGVTTDEYVCRPAPLLILYHCVSCIISVCMRVCVHTSCRLAACHRTLVHSHQCADTLFRAQVRCLRGGSTAKGPIRRRVMDASRAGSSRGRRFRMLGVKISWPLPCHEQTWRGVRNLGCLFQATCLARAGHHIGRWTARRRL